MSENQNNDEYELSLANATEYLQYKISFLTVTGGLYGAGAGYYIGGLTALYGYGYGLGCGVVGSSFYLGTYGLKCFRRKDDYVNYGLSGGFNATWMITGLYGFRRGVMAGAGGVVGGVLYKVVGDQVYGVLRQAWIEHRLHGLYKSQPRMLDIRRPHFEPRGDGDTSRFDHLRKPTIIPQVKGKDA
jgi:hypothetical protein